MISVVIPLYNKQASIAQSLKSVLSQEYDDFGRWLHGRIGWRS